MNGGDGENEPDLIKPEEMAKLESTFQTLSGGKGKISVEVAHIILKKLLEDPMFPEEEIFDTLNDEEVNKTRKLNKNGFIKLIEVIKKKKHDENMEDTELAYVAMGGLPNKEGYIDSSKLIRTIKIEFEMTIDIEKLI